MPIRLNESSQFSTIGMLDSCIGQYIVTAHFPGIVDVFYHVRYWSRVGVVRVTSCQQDNYIWLAHNRNNFWTASSLPWTIHGFSPKTMRYNVWKTNVSKFNSLIQWHHRVASKRLDLTSLSEQMFVSWLCHSSKHWLTTTILRAVCVSRILSTVKL